MELGGGDRFRRRVKMVGKPIETIKIDTSADYDFLYEGLSRQSIDFHQAIAELVDNAISAKVQGYFTIEILLHKDGDNVEVTVADDGTGITKEDLQARVLKLGGRGGSIGALNEHGFGLKNSLCLLTGNKRDFTILTACEEIADKNVQWVITGPFRRDMNAQLAQDRRWSKDLMRCKGRTGTRIIATTTLDYVRTTYPRATRIDTLTDRLAEHLGVFYRHWLAGDPRNQIWIRWKDGTGEWQDLLVPAIKLPLSDDYQSHSINVEVDGKKAHAKYIVGTLDERKTEGDHPPYPLDIYYKHNERTQGVDVVVRNKVVLTHQLEELWPELIRRRERNYFLAELVLEGDLFSTVNNKTNLDPHNPFWLRIKEQLNKRAELLPPGYSIGREEAAIRDTLVQLLETFETGSSAQKNYPVWAGAGVRADIVHEGPGGTWLDVYEIKDEKAGPQDVYQLIMYWDGLVNDGKTPRRGRLVAESAPISVVNLLKHWRGRTDLKGNHYNVEFKPTADLGIRVVRSGPSPKAKRRSKK
jgi:hypothetical protein